MTELLITNLSQEIGLVLDGIGRSSQIIPAIYLAYVGVMACGRFVELMAFEALEIPELDNLVAHHVRMRSQSFLYCLQGIAHHIVPIFLMQRYNLQREIIPACYEAAYFYVLVGIAVTAVVIASYTYVEKMQVVALLFEKM